MDGHAPGGLDLHLPELTTRPARALEDALRAAVAGGSLASGTRLPSSRTLARDLGLARNTVAEVYARLAAEGWLETRVGAGTWAAGASRSLRTPEARGSRRARYELRGGLADASDFPAAQWSAQTRRAVADAPNSAFAYTDPAGAAELRLVLAGYLARTRGVIVGAEEVFVGNGFGDLLSLLCRVVRARGGHRMAVEEYGHERHRRIIAAAGLEVIPLPVDADGADVTRLEDADVSAVLLTPAHQFPTGVPLSSERRRQVVAWAEASGALIVEDDYDGEFRYDRRSVGALQALSPESTVYLGTASKALAPAIGIAWAVAPAGLLPALTEQRELGGVTPSGLLQLTLAAFIASHEYDHAVRRRRANFRARRELLARLLDEHAPRARLEGMAAGLQCFVRLPDRGAEERAVEFARTQDVALDGISAYRSATALQLPRTAADPVAAGVVIGYGAPAPSHAERALTIAVEALAAATRASG